MTGTRTTDTIPIAKTIRRMLNIARALISAVAFLELSEDDEVDPDSAVKALEGIASYLQKATPEEVEMLRSALQIEREESPEWVGSVMWSFSTTFWRRSVSGKINRPSDVRMPRGVALRAVYLSARGGLSLLVLHFYHAFNYVGPAY